MTVCILTGYIARTETHRGPDAVSNPYAYVRAACYAKAMQEVTQRCGWRALRGRPTAEQITEQRRGWNRQELELDAHLSRESLAGAVARVRDLRRALSATHTGVDHLRKARMAMAAEIGGARWNQVVLAVCEALIPDAPVRVPPTKPARKRSRRAAA